MEKLCKSEGIILRRIDFGEADQILTVLTKEFGKLSLLAKGARRMKSKFCGRLELFYEVKLVFFRGQTLHHLNEVEVIPNPALNELDLSTRGVLFYMMEATNKLLPEGQEAIEPYELLSATLKKLQGETEADELLLYAYLSKLLTHLGFVGSFEECARTNTKLDLNEPIYLSARDSSLVRGGYADQSDMRLKPSIIKWMSYMQKEELEKLIKVRPSYGEKMEVFYVMQSVFSNILGFPLKSEAFFQLSR